MEKWYRRFIEQQAETARQRILSFSGELDDTEARAIIEDTVFSSGEELRLEECEEAIERIYARIRSRLGMLQKYIEDESINEIMVNGRRNFFYEDRKRDTPGRETFLIRQRN